ncbi:cytochrome P450 17A2 isoform X3 [Denticeps clupeoides]|uniref:cytochrome P450 17A2 isoform X3 n=1 Tax=Denticeps clupeoides TaxID=299321 RepID=UPI0010A3FDE1|nr:steroid 17-alpha-hydroxylase/17,20 lyase-like isoform X3 [Denticeps clupeoides]
MRRVRLPILVFRQSEETVVVAVCVYVSVCVCDQSRLMLTFYINKKLTFTHTHTRARAPYKAEVPGGSGIGSSAPRPAEMDVDLLVLVLLVTLALLLRCMMGRGTLPGTMPCLPRVPLLGSLLSLRSPLPPHLLFTHLTHTYGTLYTLYMGPHPTVVVSDYTHAREVLLTRGREFAGRPRMVTTELLTRGGKDVAFADYSDLWRRHRRLVHSAFNLFGEGSSKLQSIVLDAADSLCSELLSSGRSCVDPAPAVLRAVTNVVCTLVFSSSYLPSDPELLKVMQYNDGIVQTIARGSLVDIYPWLKIFPNKDLKRLNECVAVRDELLTKKLIEHKETFTPDDPRDLLDALLAGQQGSEVTGDITDDHVLMTAAEAFGAGVETTSTTLLWAMAFLLHNPEQRVQAELDEWVGRDSAPTLRQRTQLPYLDSVLCEVMRIRPVSPILIPHVAMQDTSIGLHRIPKGTRVLVNMWAIHHDPKHWDQPDCFQPERFLDSAGQKVTPPSFMPFGAGPRVCVGESLARTELFLFLGRLLQRCHLGIPQGTAPPDLQGRLGVVLQPQPYLVTISPRT